MAVTILLTPGEVDSRQQLVEQIHNQLVHQDRRDIYYVVPNHVKFDAEVDVLKRLARAQGYSADQVFAQSQVQVYSLTRLAWRFLQAEGKVQPPVLGEAGLFVLVSQILKENASLLPTFARMQAKKGFVQNLVSQLAELRGAEISPQDLLAILDQVQKSGQTNPLQTKNLNQKLRDLAIVADAFNEALAERYLLAQEALPYFVEQSENLDLSNTVIYLEGFTGFTAGEWSVIHFLIEKTDLTLAILGDKDQLTTFESGDVYAKPLTTALTIIKRAKHKEIDITVLDGRQRQSFDLVADHPVEPAEKQAATQSVSENKTRKTTKEILLPVWAKLGSYQEPEEKQVEPDLQAFVADNTVTELEEVARRIRQDLQEQPDLRLRDILVLARDLGPYSKHLPAVMNQFDLAYFLDNDIKMGNHPLVELVTKLLGPANQAFYPENILTILKTGFLRPSQDGQLISDDIYFETVAYLDNYLAGHRPSARKWHDRQAQFILFEDNGEPDRPGFDQDQRVNHRLNLLKGFVVEALDAMHQGLKRAKTLSAGARFLMTYLDQFQVKKAIINHRDALVAAGDLVKAQQVMEVWQLFINILDQVLQVSGEQVFDRQVFLASLQSGFSGGKFTGIPNQLDQLTISEAGIVQSQKYRILYFIGGTRSALPAQVKNKTVLTDQDRLLVQPALAEQETPRYLRQTAAAQMAEENLVFYGALQTASSKVVLSYPLLNQEGQKNEMSPYYSRLLNFFLVPVQPVAGQAKNLADLTAHYLGTPAATLSQLAKMTDIVGQETDFQIVRDTLADAGLGGQVDKVLSSRHYQNQARILTPALAKELFQRPLRVSISQIEAFYQNPYEYFLKYGLHLQERPSAELDAASTGIIYHDLFEKAIFNLIEKKESLRDLTPADIKAVVQGELERLVQEPPFAELNEDGQGKTVAKYLDQVAQELLKQLTQAAQTNQSVPDRVETLFGFPQGDLMALSLGEGDREVIVRGKIDRLDRQDPDGNFATLVDYKTSKKTFSYRDAANGLQLQLLTYWQAVQENAKQLGIQNVGGAFFAPIQQEVIPLAKFRGDVDELLAGKATSQSFQYRGLALDNPDYLDELERLAPKEKARYYQLTMSKDGQPTATSETIAAADFALLAKKNRELLQEAAAKIQAGQFPIRPVESALQYSAYQDIMRFDKVLGDHYQVPKYTGRKQAVIKQLQTEEDGENG
ncbi:PD-(D/E)XK nuclease family protein [Fructobacillus americanaquae]|uniref:Exodeoxyribonuclease V subunit gamma n=1 Tax=Fructobacillus americanaquae TaxID=2940302 RepID=A0ABY5C072_9LACO|nr:PD-(D/E)XK nuclease family protein [Fructobacillus americanaquae]USS91886.1 exodeoxyribonuclease V subunit gamma [Fructobacillus americanaquae]